MMKNFGVNYYTLNVLHDKCILYLLFIIYYFSFQPTFGSMCD